MAVENNSNNRRNAWQYLSRSVRYRVDIEMSNNPILLSKKLQHPVHLRPISVRDSIHRKWPSNLHTDMAETLRRGKENYQVVRQSRFHAHASSRNAFRDATHMYTNRLENYWPAVLTFASLSGERKKWKKGKGKTYRMGSIRKMDCTIEGGEIDIKREEAEIRLGRGSMWRVSKDSKASTCFPRSLPTNPERPLNELQRVRGWAGLFSHVARGKKRTIMGSRVDEVADDLYLLRPSN